MQTWGRFGYLHCHRKLLVSTWLKPLQRGTEADIEQENKTWTLNYTSAGNAPSCPLPMEGSALNTLCFFLRVLFQEQKSVKKQFTTSAMYKGTDGHSWKLRGFVHPPHMKLKTIFISSSLHWEWDHWSSHCFLVT